MARKSGSTSVILEQLKDPLVHLLRNSIDHGIETPEQRRARARHLAPRLHSPSYGEHTQVEISVSDDGAGVDVEKVKAAAYRGGLVARNTSYPLDESAALALVFETTSPPVR